MKKRYLFLHGICCILLMACTCIGQSTMTKSDFPEQGFSIVLPDEPSYGSELRKLGLQPQPFAVLVKNTSRRAVVAFGIRFTKRFDNGHIATSDVISN